MFEILSYWKEKSFDITTNTIPVKNGIGWLKYECPSDIINLRCLLLKAYFIFFFYFELETLLNKLVKLCSYFFQKNNFEQKCKVFCFHQKKSICFLTGPSVACFKAVLWFAFVLYGLFYFNGLLKWGVFRTPSII